MELSSQERILLTVAYQSLDAIIVFWEKQKRPWSITLANLKSVLIPARDHIFSVLNEQHCIAEFVSKHE